MGPSRAESVEIGSLFSCSGVSFGSLEGPCSPHAGYFGIIRPAFKSQKRENVNFTISMPICIETTTFERLCCRVGGSRGPKMVSRTVRTAKTGDFWRSSARCSVGVMETAGTFRNAAQTYIKSEVKGYLGDKTYD